MAKSSHGYDSLIKESEAIQIAEDLRFGVRVIARAYNTKYTPDDSDRRKFFVVDNEREQILFETDWNVPSDPGTNGQYKRAIAFRSGYKQRLDEERDVAPTPGQPVDSSVADQVDSAEGCNDCGGFQR